MNATEPSQPLTDDELALMERLWAPHQTYVRDLLDEVYRLQAENAAVKTERDQFRKMMNSTVSAGVTIDGERLDALRERDALRTQFDTVVALHKPTAMNSWGHRTCTHCDTPGYYQEWPCPTLVALGFKER